MGFSERRTENPAPSSAGVGALTAFIDQGSEFTGKLNGDIATDYPFSHLKSINVEHAHLILVNNPEHHPEGDFGIDKGYLKETSEIRYTYSGIGVYQAALFAECRPGKQRLAPLLRRAMSKGKVTGELYNGFWMDIGTPNRLMKLENFYTETRKD